jgi:hypothetical protein
MYLNTKLSFKKYTRLILITIFSIFSLLIMPIAQATSMSEIDLVVKEAVIERQSYNPATGVPLTFGHIGFLNFSYNDRSNNCLALVNGLILEAEDYKSNPVMGFLVCVSKNHSGLLKADVLEMYTL